MHFQQTGKMDAAQLDEYKQHHHRTPAPADILEPRYISSLLLVIIVIVCRDNVPSNVVLLGLL